MPLYNRLKEHRARLGVNQQELGRLAGGLLPLGDAGAEAGGHLLCAGGGYFYLSGGQKR